MTAVGVIPKGTLAVEQPYYKRQPVKKNAQPNGLKEKFVECARSLAHGGLELIKSLKDLRTVIVLRGGISTVMVPIKVVALCKTCILFRRYTREKKIDASLNICDLIRQIGENVATTVVSLERLKVIQRTSGLWARPFAIGLSVLSISAIAMNVRVCMRTRRLMKEMREAEEKAKVGGEISLESYRALVQVIKQEQSEDNEFASDTFNVKEKHLMHTLTEMDRKISAKLSSDKPDEVAEGRALLKKASEGLKGRVKKNITSSMTSLVASITNIVGTVILLLSPAAPVAWVVLGAATVLDVGCWIHHKVKEYHFAKSVELKRTKWQWLIC